MTAVEIRPATAHDVKTFYGQASGQSLRALVAVLDGEVVGIGGLQYLGESVVAFSKITPALKSRRRDLVRCARAVMDLIAKRNAVVAAVAEPSEPGAPRFLQRLGFQYEGSLDGLEVYVWANSQSR